MDNQKFAIVTVGYNRPDSIQRLLDSVIAAEYNTDSVDLVISIDRGNRQSEIYAVAEKVNWSHGQKIIRTFSERQGLRTHILQCGDLTDEYDAIVVLEDDLIVSPYFYLYAKQAVAFYDKDYNIAGISLYKHLMHPGVNRPFEPVNNGYDTYLMQFAQSWGQCWTRRMWQSFKNWYKKNENTDLSEGNLLPEYIASWNKQSWLKYYMRYIVENNLYFVYPMVSLSTNASDVGEHCMISNNDYQVSMLQGILPYRFVPSAQAVKYDVFFERVGIEDKIYPHLSGKKLLDLYGNRSSFGDAKYLISTRALPYVVVQETGLRYRPIEMNCVEKANGSGIYVYDLTQSSNKPKINNNIVIRYDVRSIHWKKLLCLGLSGFIYAVRDRIQRKK